MNVKSLTREEALIKVYDGEFILYGYVGSDQIYPITQNKIQEVFAKENKDKFYYVENLELNVMLAVPIKVYSDFDTVVLKYEHARQASEEAVKIRSQLGLNND